MTTWDSVSLTSSSIAIIFVLTIRKLYYFNSTLSTFPFWYLTERTFQKQISVS